MNCSEKSPQARHDDTAPQGAALTAVLGHMHHKGGLERATVICSGDRIVELAVGHHIRPAGAGVYEFPDGVIVPGLIDLHVHGAGGEAWQDGPLAIDAIARRLAANGVTTLLASLPVLPWEQLTAAVRMVAGACAVGRQPNLAGLHLEGPFLSPARAGSMRQQDLRRPSLTEYRALRAAAGECLRMMTFAPELPGADDLLAACLRDGVVPAIGHTDASYSEATAAFAAGASHVTHLFNAMRPFHHRAPGAVGAALLSPETVTAELILDGEHIDQAAWQLARAVLGPERIALVSDALPAQGAGGETNWSGLPVTRAARRLTMPNGTLAGSDITLREAVAQAVQWGAAPAEAVACASAVPARVLGLANRKGRLLPGFDADIAVFGPAWQPYLTICGGRRLWPSGAPRAPGRRSARTP